MKWSTPVTTRRECIDTVKDSNDDDGDDDDDDDDDDDVADGELYDVGWGRKMFLMCSGKGPPTGWWCCGSNSRPARCLTFSTALPG